MQDETPTPTETTMTATLTPTTFTLDEIQPIFGSEVAGNHTVHAVMQDRWVVASCFVEIGDKRGTVWFTMDSANQDWCLMTVAEAKQAIAHMKNVRADVLAVVYADTTKGQRMAMAKRFGLSPLTADWTLEQLDWFCDVQQLPTFVFDR